MTPGLRVIRFARAETGTHPGVPGSVSVARVLLDEQAEAAGQIVQHAATWEYLLPDGTSSGLTSRASRQDLERQVIMYHLGPLPAGETGGPEPVLQRAG
ncbi:MAG: hypothetical protein NT173_01730 [Opitutales bacterium]|nr:hypothetical protein [Opitutales bacterium]